MAKSSVGIYISSKYIDIVELGGSTRAPAVLNFIRQDIVALEQGNAKESGDKAALLKDSLSLAVKEGFAKLKIKSCDVYTVLPPSDVMIRHFNMPILPKAEQAQAIRFEARKYVPFKLEEIISDFKVSQHQDQPGTMGVFYIAATKQQLDSHIDIFKNIGIGVVGIDIIPFAILRTLILNKKVNQKEAHAILYIDGDKESASISIMEAGMPFLNRDIKISTDDKDAFFEKIVSELRVSVDYYRRQSFRKEVSKIIICGEEIFEGIESFVSDELKIITERLKTISGIKSAEKLPPSAVIASGVALGGLGKSHYSINLSPLAFALKKRKIVNILIAEAALALFIIFISSLFGSFQLRSAVSEVNYIKKQGALLSADTADKDTKVLTKMMANGVDELKFLSRLINNRIFWTIKLNRLAKDMPAGVWIESIQLYENLIKEVSAYPTKFSRAIIISGKAFSLDSSNEINDINAFIAALKDDKEFMENIDSVEMSSTEKKEVSGYWVTSFKVVAYSEEAAFDDKNQLDSVLWRRKF